MMPENFCDESYFFSFNDKSFFSTDFELLLFYYRATTDITSNGSEEAFCPTATHRQWYVDKLGNHSSENVIFISL